MSTDQETARSELERTQELFDFLQGMIPEGYKIKRDSRPKLTAEQAWTVIWYLGNQYWQVPDHIDRCDLCGDLYDSEREGGCLDYGKPPYHFCDVCMYSQEYGKKAARNPDKSMRPSK